MRCYCYWENNQYRNICFISIKLALIKSYHFRMWSRVLLWFRKLPQWNHYVKEIIFESGLRSKGWPQWNCHVNKTSFQSGLRLQNGLCSLWVSCKRALSLVYFGFIFIFLPNGRIVALLLTSIFVKFALIRKEKRWYFRI